VIDQALMFVGSDPAGSGRLHALAARRLGLRPVLLALAGERDGCYDEVYTLPSLDRDAVTAWCRAFTGRGGRIAGIMTSDERHTGTAAHVARAAGLPHPDPEAIARCRNKADARAYLSAAGVPVPGWALCRTQSDVARAADRLGPLVVVKPVDGSGSVGVRLAGDPYEAQEAAEPLLAAGAERGTGRLPGVLVEGYVSGPELSVELWNGRAVTAVRKHLGPEPAFVETGHDVPAPLSSVDIAWVCQAAEEAAAALGTRWGPVHVELRLAADLPRVIEVNARLAGGHIPRLVQLATGVDLIALHVAQSAGLPTAAPRYDQLRGAAIRFLTVDRPVRVQSAPQRHGSGDRRVVEVTGTLVPGAEYRPSGDHTDRVGHVITVAEDADEAAAVAEEETKRLAHAYELLDL
jgi:S-sulfo-L-cysteine synthase (3-phospho-L-serine-dependent)